MRSLRRYSRLSRRSARPRRRNNHLLSRLMVNRPTRRRKVNHHTCNIRSSLRPCRSLSFNRRACRRNKGKCNVLLCLRSNRWHSRPSLRHRLLLCVRRLHLRRPLKLRPQQSLQLLLLRSLRP